MVDQGRCKERAGGGFTLGRWPKIPPPTLSQSRHLLTGSNFSEAFGCYSARLSRILPADLGSLDLGWSDRAVERLHRSPRDSGSPCGLGGGHGGASGTASALGGPRPPPQIQLWGESWSQRPICKNTGSQSYQRPDHRGGVWNCSATQSGATDCPRECKPLNRLRRTAPPSRGLDLWKPSSPPALQHS